MELDARLQQRLAPFRVTRVDRRDVRRLQRIGQDADLHTPFRQRREGLHAAGRRHEIRRHEIEAGCRLANDAPQPVGQQLALARLALSLARIVADQRDAAPLQRAAAGHHLRYDLGLAQRRKVTSGAGIAFGLRRGVLHRRLIGHLIGHRIGSSRAAQQRRQRIGRGAGPVAVEVGRYVGHDGADGQHVQVGEQHAFRGAEILVADIAAAGDRRLVVGGEGFIVHAPVGPAKTGDIAERLQRPERERIEQPHFDAGIGVEPGEDVVHAGDAVIVQQQPHAHAPLRRLPQRVEQQRAGDVVVPDVVLHVERAFGRARQQHARGEGLLRVGQRQDTRLPGMRDDLRGQADAETRCGRGIGRQGAGLRAAVQRRQGAARQQQAGRQPRHEAVWGTGLCDGRRHSGRSDVQGT